MNPISNVSSSVSEQAIATLQSQMHRYAQLANGHSSQASADYKALQNAIKSGNVSQAQTALARLQRDSKAANSGTPEKSSLSGTGKLPIDGESGHDASTGVPPVTEGILNVTA